MHGPCGQEHCDCGFEIERLKVELEALIGLEETGLDDLLERWDLTDPGIQRQIVARFAALYTSAKQQRDELLAAAYGVELIYSEFMQLSLPPTFIHSEAFDRVTEAVRQARAAVSNCKD